MERQRSDCDIDERVVQRDLRERFEVHRHRSGIAHVIGQHPVECRWKRHGPGLTSCAIKLTGTATIGTDSIIVPYQGTTCLGRSPESKR